MTVANFLNAWNKPASTDPKEPDVCGLCGQGIAKEDKYYFGYTSYAPDLVIWAYTCTNPACTRWLIAKKLLIKEK